MQKWEHLIVSHLSGQFSVISSRGYYLTKDYYQSIDPKGKTSKDFQWFCGIDHVQFLAKILDRLGAEGWETVGNIAGGDMLVSHIVLKRPIE